MQGPPFCPNRYNDSDRVHCTVHFRLESGLSLMAIVFLCEVLPVGVTERTDRFL